VPEKPLPEYCQYSATHRQPNHQILLGILQ